MCVVVCASNRQKGLDMECLQEIRANCKAIAEAKISSTAKLIGITMQIHGIVSVAEIMAATGLPRSTVYRAQAEYFAAGLTSPTRPTYENPTRLTCPTSENPTSPTDGNCSENSVSVVSPVGICDLARVEDNTSLTSLEDSSENLVIPPIVPPAVSKTKRGTRLPEDWSLPDDWRDWSRVNCPAASAEMINREALKFANYWQAKAGRDAAKIDWRKTWQNWCLTAFATAPTRPVSSTPHWVDEKREKNRKFLEMVRNLPAGGVPA